ncbi:MAG TPA: hypothetical protein PLW67_09345 [Prolixibacteraceae bacterium]|nr:hypothetical protein [Prolixibacteraceae bacterium]
MKTSVYIAIILLFLMGSCKKDQDPAGSELNQELTLKTGDVRNLNPNNLSIKVLNIIDSRCPTGVVCFWQGEATVTLEVKENSSFDEAIGTLILSTFHQPVDTVSGYIFRLIDVLPYPVYGVEVPEKDKKVVLKIDRL